jgi:hypothetical protein
MQLNQIKLVILIYSLLNLSLLMADRNATHNHFRLASSLKTGSQNPAKPTALKLLAV